MGMTKDVFDEYGNYKYPDYSNSQYTHDVSTTGGAMMGMTIDKAIEEVQQQKLDYQEFWEEYKNEHIEALDMAIDTMRKYQRIQEIVRWNEAPSPYYKPDGQLFREICEVLEDEGE